jgi:hypothetical protein
VAVARSVILDLVGQSALARDLAAGGVLVPDVLTVGDDVELHLRGAADELSLAATCVWVGSQGSGLQLAGCDAEMKQRIASLAERASATSLDYRAPQRSSATALDHRPTEIDTSALPQFEDPDVDPTEHSSAAPGDPDATEETSAAPADPDMTEEAQPVAPGDETVEESVGDETDVDGKKAPANIHERLRGLTLAQQVKVASHGEVSERMLLERMYGKNVWEPLLRNPRLTGPEVSRIARMGALPRPLMEIILGNGGWLQIPEVRRALLTNPRLGVDQITKILRLLPKHELKMAAMQSAYSFGVRDVAKRLLKEQGGG